MVQLHIQTQIHELLSILIGIRLDNDGHVVYNEHIEIKKELK